VLLFAIIAIALLFPLLLLLDLWRSRPVVVPEEAQGEAAVDPILLQGGGRKALFAILLLVEGFLLILAYTINEPARQAQAVERQTAFAQDQGAHTYVQYCLSCHGLQGRGFLEGFQYVGRPLNIPDFQPADPQEKKKIADFLYKTIQNGRPGTPMPAWGVENGGPLNYEMINELVALVTGGRWDLVEQTARKQAVATPTPAPLPTDPVELGKLITTTTCAACHTIQGTQARGTIGPDLTNINARGQIAGVLPLTAPNLKRWITNPQAVKPGTAMPPYPLSEANLDAIAAYLLSLPR